MDYKGYLQQKGYAKSTVLRYDKETAHFIKWCKRNHTTPQAIDYKNCMKYIKYLQRGKVSKRSANQSLGYLKSYLNYLVATDARADHPIADTIIRGVQRTMNYNLLEPEELEDLYYSYQSDDNGGNATNIYQYYTAKRNKIIVGFMMYQGLKTEDLKSLKEEHLQVHKGKLYVPSRKKSNARELELKPWQIMGCIEYQNEIRQQLVKRLKNYEDTGQLFPYTNRFTMITTIIKQLKKYNQKVNSTKQIRASVITHWLGQYNLRKVQYLAGHRYISSTERYLQDDLENLHEIVNNYHPIH